MKRYLVVLAILAVGRTSLGADSFGIGNAHSGDSNLSGCSGNTVVNVYTPLASITTAQLTVGSTTNFVAGDLVLIWRPAAMSASTVGSSNQNEFLLTGTTGQFELGRVGTIDSSTKMTLTAAVAGAFDSHSQVVKVPEFAGFSLPAACTLTATPWDGASGGIVAFFSDDNAGASHVTQINGVISADGAGFEGVPTQANSASHNCGGTDNLSIANGGSWRGENITSVNFPVDVAPGIGNIGNGGGGGNCTQSGGGGGGNGALGGAGGSGSDATIGGNGGAPVAWRSLISATDSLYATPSALANGSLTTRFTLGGAGGHGQQASSSGLPGANGGGVVFIRARHITGSGSIHANGATPGSGSGADGQGGGGAGGTVIIRLEGATSICSGIQAKGGVGGGTSASGVGGGGGGSGGRVLLQTSTACSLPASSLSGGLGGLANGSPSGSSGAAGTRETMPGGVYCPNDGTGDTLCLNANAALPHCNTTFNFCAECASNSHCINPAHPVCSQPSGTCTTCTNDSDCTGAIGGPYCITSGANTGKCVSCRTAADCSGSLGCVNNLCTSCGSDANCVGSPGGSHCGAGGTCFTCVSASDCASSLGCVSGDCTACTSDASCAGNAGGNHCCGGACIPTGDCCADADCNSRPDACYLPTGTCALAGGGPPHGTCQYVKRSCPLDPCKSAPHCQPSDGTCIYDDLYDGGSCGGLCYSTGTCVHGVCSGTPKDCTSMDGPCAKGTCDSATGDCGALPIAAGDACTLADLCMLNATCVGGACVAASMMTCAAPALCMTNDCDPATGQCAATPVTAGTKCDSQDSCSFNESCDGVGHCTGQIKQDGSPCNAAGCGASGFCAQGVCICSDGDGGVPSDLSANAPDLSPHASGASGCSIGQARVDDPALGLLLASAMLLLFFRIRPRLR